MYKLTFLSFIKRCMFDKTLLPIKMHYFVFFAALGCNLPYRTVFAEQLGLSGTATGIIFAITPFIKMITNPIFGSVVDHWKQFRLVIIFACTLGGLSSAIVVFIPPLESEIIMPAAKVTFECFPTHNNVSNISISILSDEQRVQCSSCNESYGQLCSLYKNDKINVINDTKITMSKTTKSKKINFLFNTFSNSESKNVYSITINSSKKLSLNCFSKTCVTPEQIFENAGFEGEAKSLQFWLLTFLFTCSAACFAAVMFLMDAACYELLIDKDENYGQQRLWGSVGYGVGSLLSGYVVGLATIDSTAIDFAPCFYILALLCVLNIIPVSFIKVENISHSENIFKDVKKALTDLIILSHMLMAFFVGILSGPVWNFLTWYLKDIGASSLLMGLALSVECFVAELPSFLISGWVIKKIGHTHCTSLAFLCLGLRYMLFYYIKNPWLSLPVNLLHGPTFGIYFASLTHFGKEHALPGTEATMQSLFFFIFEGFGVALGTLLGGVLFFNIGSRDTMWYLGISSVVLLVVHFNFSWLLQKIQLRKKYICYSKEVEK